MLDGSKDIIVIVVALEMAVLFFRSRMAIGIYREKRGYNNYELLAIIAEILIVAAKIIDEVHLAMK